MSMTAPLDEKDLMDRICHKEQIGIWANEVLTAMSLGDFLREEWSFDDSVDAEREIEAQLRNIIASAISNPEYNLLANLETAEAQVKRLTEALNEIRALNMTAEDENGHRWSNSDMIEQTIVFALSGSEKE